MMRSLKKGLFVLLALALATQLACGGAEDPRCAEIMGKVQQCFPESPLPEVPQCSADLLDYYGIIMSNSCEALFNIGKGDGDRLIPALLLGAGLGLGGAWLWNNYTSCMDGAYQPKCDSGWTSQFYMDNYAMGGSISVCYMGKVAHKRCFQGCQEGPNGPYCVEDGPYGSNLYAGNGAQNCQMLSPCYQGCMNCQQTICGYKCLDGANMGMYNNGYQTCQQYPLCYQGCMNCQQTVCGYKCLDSGGMGMWNSPYYQNCQQYPQCYQGCTSCQQTPCGPKCINGMNNGFMNNQSVTSFCMQACQMCMPGSGYTCLARQQQALGICAQQGVTCTSLGL